MGTHEWKENFANSTNVRSIEILKYKLNSIIFALLFFSEVCDTQGFWKKTAGSQLKTSWRSGLIMYHNGTVVCTHFVQTTVYYNLVLKHEGQFVQKPITTNPGLKVHQSFRLFFLCVCFVSCFTMLIFCAAYEISQSQHWRTHTQKKNKRIKNIYRKVTKLYLKFTLILA